MQTLIKNLLLLLPAVLALVSCQPGFDVKRAYATSPDAVVSINQVDPAYRAYFRAQHASNFSLSDQRRAFAAAVETARTPVPRYMPASVAKPKKSRVSSRSRIAKRGSSKAYRRSATAKRKKGASSRRKAMARNTRKRRR